MYPLEPEILICIDLHLPYYLYDLSCIHHYASKHKLYKDKYFLIINICKKNLRFHLLSVLSMPCKLDYALETQKWKASHNCLTIYEEPFHT